MGGPLASDDFVASANDEVRLLRIQFSELEIREGRRLFHQAEGLDHGKGELVSADLEVAERSFGLRSPVLVALHLDIAHAVSFNSKSHDLSFTRCCASCADSRATRKRCHY